MGLPYYQMYPKDFDADESVRLMTDAQLGLYLRLLNYSWINNGLPVDPDKIKLTLPGVSWDGFAQNWPAVEACFPRTRDNRRRNKRQEIERQKADRTSKVNRTNALTRSDRSTESEDVRSGLARRHAGARADSGSISNSSSESETTIPSTQSPVPKPMIGDESFPGFVAAWGDCGARTVSGPDWTDAEWRWRGLDFEGKLAALKGLALRKSSDDFALKSLPGNYLSKRMWERSIEKKSGKPNLATMIENVVNSMEGLDD